MCVSTNFVIHILWSTQKLPNRHVSESKVLDTKVALTHSDMSLILQRSCRRFLSIKLDSDIFWTCNKRGKTQIWTWHGRNCKTYMSTCSLSWLTYFSRFHSQSRCSLFCQSRLHPALRQKPFMSLSMPCHTPSFKATHNLCLFKKKPKSSLPLSTSCGVPFVKESYFVPLLATK